jgi:hypothetical protein
MNLGHDRKTDSLMVLLSSAYRPYNQMHGDSWRGERTPSYSEALVGRPSANHTPNQPNKGKGKDRGGGEGVGTAPAYTSQISKEA